MDKSRFSSDLFALTVLLLAAVIYMLTMPIHYVLYDPVRELGFLATDAWKIRPNHLLTTPLYSVILRLGRFVLPGLKPFIYLQCFIIATTLVGAIGIYRLSSAYSSKRWIPRILMIQFLFSYGVLVHGRTVETDMAPLVLCIWVTIKLVATKSGSTDMRRLAIGGVLYSLSLLLSLLYILLMPAFLVYLIFSFRNTGRTAKAILTFITPFLVIVLISYSIIPALSGQISSVTEFFHWISTHPDAKLLTHFSFGAESMFRSASGFLSMLVNLKGVTTWFKLLLRGEAPPDIDYLMIIKLFFSIGIGALLLGSSLKGTRKNIAIGLSHWITFIIVFLFGSFWLGSDPQFWLPIFPFLVLTVTLGISNLTSNRAKKFTKTSLLFGLVLLPFINLPVREPSILFPKGDSLHQTALTMKNHLKPHDVVFTPGGGWVMATRKLQPDVDVILLIDEVRLPVETSTQFSQALVNAIERNLDDGKRVFFDGLIGRTRFNHVGPWEIVASFRGVDRSKLANLLSQYFSIDSIPSIPKNQLVQIRKKQ